jgi:hypothetical protein
MLAAAWLWVGIMFHIRRYSTINWAADYFGALFVAQSILLVWIGVVRAKPIVPVGSRRYAWWLVLAAFIAPPLVARLVGLSWTELDVMGLTPDATTVGTIGVLAFSPSSRWLLLVVPLVWCVVGGATLWALATA